MYQNHPVTHLQCGVPVQLLGPGVGLSQAAFSRGPGTQEARRSGWGLQVMYSYRTPVIQINGCTAFLSTQLLASTVGL